MRYDLFVDAIRATGGIPVDDDFIFPAESLEDDGPQVRLLYVDEDSQDIFTLETTDGADHEGTIKLSSDTFCGEGERVGALVAWKDACSLVTRMRAKTAREVLIAEVKLFIKLESPSPKMGTQAILRRQPLAMALLAMSMGGLAIRHGDHNKDTFHEHCTALRERVDAANLTWEDLES